MAEAPPGPAAPKRLQIKVLQGRNLAIKDITGTPPGRCGARAH